MKWVCTRLSLAVALVRIAVYARRAGWPTRSLVKLIRIVLKESR